MILNITLLYVSLTDKISKFVIISDITPLKVICFIVLKGKLLTYLTQNQIKIGLLTLRITHKFKNIFENINTLIKQSKKHEDISAYCNATKQIVDDLSSSIKCILDIAKNEKKETEKMNFNKLLKEMIYIIEKIYTTCATVSYLNFISDVQIKKIPFMLKQIINITQIAFDAIKGYTLVDFVKIEIKDSKKKGKRKIKPQVISLALQ